MTGSSNRRVSLAALIAVKPGRRPRLIYRVRKSRPRGKDQRKGVTEADCARLLDAAHQQLGGPIVLVWDNLNAHVSDAMAALIAARDWLTVYRLPPYAHELNPVEPVWSHLKRSLANLAKRNLAQLTALIKTRLKRMQYRPGLLDGFLASTRLDLTPSVTPTIRDLYALMDLTVYGRQESWENSPPGWPQQCSNTRTDGGAPAWPPVPVWPGGRPIAQWPRLEAGRPDDLGPASR